MDNLEQQILKLKKERNAVILAHNYQLGEIQDIADFVGDSLELSQQAAKTNADVIVFCGVDFMAETASILCPDKTVLLPEIHANCPMANMITAEKLIKRKAELPGAAVVCYVNTTAEVKAESDICCTSANAVKVVESLPDKEILFVPVQYLGYYVSTKVRKKMTFWPGFCITHTRILPKHINEARKDHPAAKVIVHPECRPEVQALADEVLSTGGMIRYARRDDVNEVIVGTEFGILHRLRKENPNKKFYPATEQAVCPRMKLTTLESVVWSLQEMVYVIKVPEHIRVPAKAAVDRMLQIV
ncbi:MAG: quinolinate synthase NadA [Chloroflexi bacterium]|nr:quinolinate synthase NadA [Chloroflexota bacterium]